MKKKITKIFVVTILLLTIIAYNPFIAYADSGLETNYNSEGSVGEALISSASSFLTVLAEMLKTQPGDEDYGVWHIILSIISIIIFYIFTNKYILRIRNKRLSKSKDTFIMLAINLIPTLAFSLLYFLTKWQFISYIFFLIMYILTLKIITSIIIKIRITSELNKVKKIDEKINIKELKNDTFNIYKKVQEAWVEFNSKELKKLISKELYDTYEKQLEELNSNNHKNIMDKIELKSNKITEIKLEKNIEIIKCEMKVTCYDYIADKDGKEIKGKKDRKYTFIYDLEFNKDIKDNKYTLIKKHMVKQK